MIDIIIPSFILSLSLVLIHVYFGLRIFERGIIFSDIAVAQVSALGIAFSSLLGLENLSYIFGVGFSAIGGLLLSAMRKYSVELKESFVGILYAFSSALGILIFSKMPEHEIQGIKEMLMGNILFVDTEDVLKGTIVYISVGFVHFLLRKKIKNGSFFWEFFFYLTFGFVVSSSVSMGGVLLVFSYLVIPTFCSNLILKNFTSKLIFGWILGTISNLIGFFISIKLDYPTGVSVIVVLGAISFMFLLFSKLMNK